ncbi:atypical chemokine receptor 4 [Candoia aspera]|uniref:atypical chemokine receptor 4 n=1 Tax=Candoia aspera TaxID=51853 RepID=UPI002FD7E653
MKYHINISDDYYDYYDYDKLNVTLDYAVHDMICVKEEVRSFSQSFLPAFYSIVFLAGVAGNFLVVAIYAYFKKWKTKTDIYILNLAIADLLLLFTLPFWAGNAVHGWVFGIPLCKITAAIYAMNFSTNMQFLACISIDRYHAIIQPQGHPITRSTRKLCSFVWIVAFFLCVPELTFRMVITFHGRYVCLAMFPTSWGKMAKIIIDILEIALSFVLPLLIILICYSAIARILLKSSRAKKSQPLKVLAAVVIVFILTQLPYNILKLWKTIHVIFHLIQDCGTIKITDVALQVSETLALFHSCLNPILFFFMGTSFKMHIINIAKHYGCWKRQDSMITEEIPMDCEDSAEQTNSFTI